MKTVEMWRDYDYHPHPRVTVRFRGGCTYAHVIEAAAREIETAHAGRIVHLGNDAGVIDARQAFRTKGK